ncbi:hypothetical protein [Plantactinospora soyae]|uniref:Uncharacterized protein n=1 Tax=Plantactinospora soyae TaxID=1544732 RepID=A0A927QZW8_9ACTN|nr:hypothetical protein [Plantactinospora soyae]MBE1490890.1 hypothetical protein [Plantactinospora soyae]
MCCSDRFSEFCAETFVQFAMGGLGTHIAQLVNSDMTPPAIKKAWRATAQLSLMRGHPVLNGGCGRRLTGPQSRSALRSADWRRTR